MQALFINAGEDVDGVLAFVDAADLSSPVLFDTDSDVYKSYDLQGLGGYAPFPLQIVIDREGTITYMAKQYDAVALRAALDAAVAE